MNPQHGYDLEFGSAVFLLMVAVVAVGLVLKGAWWTLRVICGHRPSMPLKHDHTGNVGTCPKCNEGRL